MNGSQCPIDAYFISAWKEICRIRKRLREKLRAPSPRRLAERRGHTLDHPSKFDAYADPDVCKVNQLFATLSNERLTALRRSSDIEKQWWADYVIAEMTSLRTEISEIKQREIVSERFVSGGLAAIFVAYSKNIITAPEIFIIPILFSAFGFIRFREYQRNIFEIDCYLREIELIIRRDRGWVSTFFTDRSMGRYFESRVWFWVLLISLSIFIAVSANFFGYSGTDLTIVVRQA